MAAVFVCYERVGDSNLARVTQSGTIIDHEPYARQLEEKGISFIMIPLDGFTGYISLDAEGSPREMHLRERFTGVLDKDNVEMMEIATIPDVPPCQVRFAGPATASTVVHQGGDLQMKFGVPGTYSIAFESFPLLPYEASLVVRNPNTINPEVV